MSMQTTEPLKSEVGARLIAGLKPFDPSTWTLPPMFSADSHVQEPDDLYHELPEELQNNIPNIFRSEAPPGAGNPELRVKDQDLDGVGAEIIFPNKAMVLFGLDDVPTQEAAMRVYNDWMADFCKVSPKRLYGVPALSVYDIEGAVKELHRTLDMGLTGAMIWQVPDPKLPFSSPHYDPLWAAAAEAKAPVHFHILTGHSYTKQPGWAKAPFLEKLKNSVNIKTADTIDTLHDIMFSAVFERHPDLRIVLAESEVGWLPYILQQWDYYYDRFRANGGTPPISRKPSEIFEEHVYCTFLEDFAGTRHFNWWGQNNCMWSNDYPHFNMTFPHSRANVIRHLGDLPHDIQLKLVRDNAVRLYGIDF
jgi:predicted TIM-barrel fold metal-dependent hydrolase